MRHANTSWAKGGLSAFLIVQLVSAGPVHAQARALAPSSLGNVGGQRRIVVLTVPLDDVGRAAAGDLHFLAEQALTRSNRFSLMRLADELDKNAAEERQIRAKAADAHWSKGMRAYEELETKRAAEDFGESLKKYKQADLTRHFSSLSKALVMYVAALLANGETRAANIEIDKILAVDPRAVFSPDYFPPDTLKLVEDARQNAQARTSSEWEVKTSPSGAQVFVNGYYRGTSPLKLRGLPRGEHWLNVVAPGYSMVQQLAVPGVNEFALNPAEAHGRWKSTLERIAKDNNGPGRDEAAVLLGKWLNADEVMLVLAQRGSSSGRLELRVLRIDCQDGHNAAYQVATVSTGAGLLTEADAVLSESAMTQTPRNQGAPVSHFNERRRSGPGLSLSKNTLAWTLVGTAGALLVGGIVVGSVAGSQNTEFKATPQQDPASEGLKSSGQTFALTADLLYLGALLAGAPGGYLLWKDGESPAKEPEKRPEETAEAVPVDLLK